MTIRQNFSINNDSVEKLNSLSQRTQISKSKIISLLIKDTSAEQLAEIVKKQADKVEVIN